MEKRHIGISITPKTPKYEKIELYTKRIIIILFMLRIVLSFVISFHNLTFRAPIRYIQIHFDYSQSRYWLKIEFTYRSGFELFSPEYVPHLLLENSDLCQ